MKQKLDSYSDDELIAELIDRNRKRDTDIVILTAAGEHEQIHLHAPLEMACRLGALLFSALINMFQGRFNLTPIQGRELLYESLNKLISERLNFVGATGVKEKVLQEKH